MSRKLMNTSDGTGRTLLDQEGEVLTESEYRKLYENQQIEGQTLPEASVYAYNSPQQYLNDRMETGVKRNSEAILSAPKSALELITDTPANFVGEILQGKNFDYRRVIPSGIREYTGWNAGLVGRRGSDSFLGAGEVGEDGIRHANNWLGKTRNFALDVATDPWSFIGTKAIKDGIVAAEKKLLMDATQRGIKIAPKELNKLLTNELQRELGKNIDQGTAIKNAFSNVAKKELGKINYSESGVNNIINPSYLPDNKVTEAAASSFVRYQKEVNNYRNIEKIKALYGDNADKLLETFNDIIISNKNLELFDPVKGRSINGTYVNSRPMFDLSKASTLLKNPEDIFNLSADKVAKLVDKFNMNEYRSFIKPSDAKFGLNRESPINRIYNVMSHEGKHSFTYSDDFIPKSYKDEIFDAIETSAEYFNNSKKRLVDKGAFTESAHVDNINAHKYLSTPTEVQAFLGTNLKDELKHAKLINSIHDNVTIAMIDKLIDKGVLSSYKNIIKDKKKLVNLINKTPYALGAGIIINPTTNAE